MRDTTRDSDNLIYLLIREMKSRQGVALATCWPEEEIDLEKGHIVRPITKAEYESYVALGLFATYVPENPTFVWVARAGPTGLYFGREMWEEEKRYAKRGDEW